MAFNSVLNIKYLSCDKFTDHKNQPMTLNMSNHHLMKEFNYNLVKAEQIIEQPFITDSTLFKVSDLIKLTKEAGGFTSLAHPHFNLSKIIPNDKYNSSQMITHTMKALQWMLTEGELKGLDALEIVYPSSHYVHPLSGRFNAGNKSQNRIFNALLKIAKQNNLYVSAGDDYHGADNHEDIQEIGYIAGQPIIYFDFLHLIAPDIAKERYEYLVSNGYMKPNEKIFVAPENIYSLNKLSSKDAKEIER